MSKFQPGKRYTFSKDKWLTDTGNVWLYQSCQSAREWVDKSDGKEIKSISANGMFGYVNKHMIAPEDCDIIESKRRITFRSIIQGIQREDRLLERINMIQDEINELEMHVSILKDEQDSVLEELREVQEGRSQAEDIAWRQMKI